MTISEVMHKLYGIPGRWVTALASIVMGLGTIAVQAIALGDVFHYFLGVNLIYGIFIGYGVITVYSALGGIRSVIPTEIFKFALFLSIIPASYIINFITIGGPESIIQKLPESHLSLEPSGQNIKLLISLYSIGIIFGYLLYRYSGHKLESFQEITTVGSIGYVYLFFVLTSLVFFRKAEKQETARREQDKIEIM